MEEVPVSELRANLQRYLSRARAGARLRVTARGRVIAELGPPEPPRRDADAALARLRGSLLGWDDPLAPAFAADEWDALR